MIWITLTLYSKYKEYMGVYYVTNIFTYFAFIWFFINTDIPKLIVLMPTMVNVIFTFTYK